MIDLKAHQKILIDLIEHGLGIDPLTVAIHRFDITTQSDGTAVVEYDSFILDSTGAKITIDDADGLRFAKTRKRFTVTATVPVDVSA